MKKIHFIGLGGIGVSALARFFLARGDEVSGSDVCDSPILRDLEKLGAKIFTPHQNKFGTGQVGHKAENIPSDADLIIYSAAVQDDNPELAEARRQGLKCQKYAEALGDLTHQMWTIAVSGMHGKSTTTAMIGLILERAGLDPTVIVGTKVQEWGNSNCRVGKSQYLVIEADEYDRSFLNYWPKILVLLNIEEEHLDTYTGGLADIIKTFSEYVGHLPEDGVLVANEEDENISKIKNQNAKLQFKIQNFNSKAAAGLKLKIPGKHNISNANAALAVARALGINEKIALEALNDFSGTWRRMEYKGEVNGAKIYDDYGHHPTEIKATLAGARELSEKIPPNPPFTKWGRKLWCVFQPHQYHRTQDLFDKFVGAFDLADKVILLPIYSVTGREDEEIKRKVSSEKLAVAINNVKLRARKAQWATGLYWGNHVALRNQQSAINGKKEVLSMGSFDEAVAYLRKNLQEGDVAIIMGAGDINQLTDQLTKQ